MKALVTFVFDTDDYDVVQDGRSFTVDSHAYGVVCVETGECMPGLLSFFRTVQQWYSK